jgi:sentrin-specific protease 8
MAADKVLSYFDVVLRQGDVDLLTGPFWLNDQLIAFYFELLSRENFKDVSEILLIPGAATYLIISAGGFIPIKLFTI